MQESCTYGSVRGAPGNGRPYRDIWRPAGHLWTRKMGAGGSIEVVFTVEAQAGDDPLVGSLSIPSAPNSNVASSPSKWIASLPLPVRNPAVLALAAFGLGVLFGRFQHNGRVGPAIATGAATVVVLVIMVAVVVSDTNLANGSTSASRKLRTLRRNASCSS